VYGNLFTTQLEQYFRCLRDDSDRGATRIDDGAMAKKNDIRTRSHLDATFVLLFYDATRCGKERWRGTFIHMQNDERAPPMQDGACPSGTGAHELIFVALR
jgi:hypothetical protein